MGHLHEGRLQLVTGVWQGNTICAIAVISDFLCHCTSWENAVVAYTISTLLFLLYMFLRKWEYTIIDKDGLL